MGNKWKRQDKEEKTKLEVFECHPRDESKEWNFQYRREGQSNIDKIRELMGNTTYTQKNARYIVLEEGEPIKLYQTVYSESTEIYEVVPGSEND